jgi:hypothetical protein
MKGFRTGTDQEGRQRVDSCCPTGHRRGAKREICATGSLPIALWAPFVVAPVAMFLTLLHRWESAELNQVEAAELRGVSEWNAQSWRDPPDRIVRCINHTARRCHFFRKFLYTKL